MPSARFGATRRSWKSSPGSSALDRALTVAAVAYFAAVIVFTILVHPIIGLASALGSASAEDAANDPDYGISAVLGASLGALFASGLRAGDRMITGFGIAGFIGLLPFSLGWLDVEHPLAFALGAAVVLRLGSTDPVALRRQR